MMKQTDILIIGGGVAGLTLAILLGREGVDVTLVDNAPPPPVSAIKPSGRTVALLESSLNVLRATDIWDAITSYAAPLKTMRLIDDSGQGPERTRADFNAADLGQDQYGYNIPNGILRAALHEQAKTVKSLRLLAPQTLQYYSTAPGGVTAHLGEGMELQARLIVGTDGRESAVRKIAGIKARKTPYNQTAITFLINHSRSHENIATEFHRPAGPLALVPLPGNQSSVVWVETPERAEELIRLKKSEFESLFRKEIHDILGGVTLETGLESWPLCAISARRLSAPRTALAAEACHVMSPITAQGLNLSLRDVAALAEITMDALRLGLDPGTPDILNRYEKRRRLDIKTRIHGVDGMNRMVNTNFEPLKALRRAGLKTVDSIPPLKTMAMRIGLAPEIDLGRLARGEAL